VLSVEFDLDRDLESRRRRKGKIAGIREKEVPSLARNFFYDPDSHQVIEGHCNCANREFAVP